MGSAVVAQGMQLGLHSYLQLIMVSVRLMCGVKLASCENGDLHVLNWINVSAISEICQSLQDTHGAGKDRHHVQIIVGAPPV